ncbi:MAG: cysteine dioxygenase family protein [Solirubrobacterales bacterium]|nr:cysteine dioxygenase family protein [Solirubrobacterales bacterium]MBV9915817.1 cysteine dioxygenase family protein [Solirubrobacterales bacterium]
MSLSPEALERFVCELAASPERWRRFAEPSRDARVYQRIWDDQQVNAWVICWDHGHDTGFHDHDQSSAAILVVNGRVREERLRIAGAPASRTIGPGAPCFVPASAIHRVQHAGQRPAVTLHAYSPPLRRTGAYTVGAGGELTRTAQAPEQELRGEPALS